MCSDHHKYRKSMTAMLAFWLTMLILTMVVRELDRGSLLVSFLSWVCGIISAKIYMTHNQHKKATRTL